MIFHLCVLDKFIEPFFVLLKKNFTDFDSGHKFYINGTSDTYKMPMGANVFHALSHNPISRYILLLRQLNNAEKIILHGLFDRRVLLLLSIQPWLLKKCYWIIWGGDLYTHVLSKRTLGWWRFEILRQLTIRNFGYFITHIRGDYELAQKWYGAEGVWHECFMYPSNLYHEPPIHVSSHVGINILLGNSADPSNNHIDALDRLKLYADDNINIFCPLSYGNLEYPSSTVYPTEFPVTI